MVNPLRFPIVFMLVMAAMLGFVHLSHRKLQHDAPPQPVLAVGNVNLRKQSAEAIEPSMVRSTLETHVIGSRREIPVSTATATATTSTVTPPKFTLTPRDPGVEPVKDVTQQQKLEPVVAERPQRRHVVLKRRPTVQRRHRIVDGDTLDRLAEKYLGDAERAQEIYEANRGLLVDPSLLPIGEKLIIPSTGSSSI